MDVTGWETRPVQADQDDGETVIQLPYRFERREYQDKHIWQPFVLGNYLRLIAVWHRRAGKDKTIWNACITKAMQRVGLYLYLLPEQIQAKKVIWRGIGSDGIRFIDHVHPELVESINNTEMVITLKNGSLIQLGGADNYNSFMGTNPLGIVFSEYSLQDPAAWDYFRPILAENGGWALFDYTPRGKNHGYTLMRQAQKNPQWYVSVLTVDDTQLADGRPVVSKEAIESERLSGMADDMILQEFYCSFEAALLGAYFGKEMRQAWEDKRICRVPIEPALPVFTFWDLGMGDEMAIWLLQPFGKELRMVQYYENSGEGMAHYINWLKDWQDQHKIRFEKHFGPHDLAVRELMGDGKTRQEVAKSMGIEFEIVPRVQQKADSIQAARAILPRVVFDEERCERGIAALTEYQREYDEKHKCFKPRPLHNWASNGSDAFQQFAMSWADGLTQAPKPLDLSPTSKGGWMAV